MNTKNRVISTALYGLILASALMVGCSQNEPRDYKAIATQAEVIRGEGTGTFADIAISAASMFKFDKADLNEDGKAVIDDAIKTLGPELTDAYLVLVVGHTDTSGDENHNLALSLDRAESVADYLISTGVKSDAIRVIGRGSKDPLASNETREGRMQNRRVDILAVAELRNLDTMVFPNAALFEPKSAELNEEGRALLEENRMKARDLLSRAVYIEVVGHTDSVVDEEDFTSNLQLSVQRAETVRDYLVSKGLDASKILTSGKGATMPIAGNYTDEGRAQNRRVEVLILGRLKE